jgi:hypothetical protein
VTTLLAEYLTVREYIFSACRDCRDMVRFPARQQIFALVVPIEALPATGKEMVVLFSGAPAYARDFVECFVNH